MAAKLKDLKVTVGAAAQAIAKAGLKVRDVEEAARAVRKAMAGFEKNSRVLAFIQQLQAHGWKRSKEYGKWNWWCPYQSFLIREETLLSNQAQAEEIFMEWLHRLKHTASPPGKPPKGGTVSGTTLARSAVTMGKVYPARIRADQIEWYDDRGDPIVVDLPGPTSDTSVGYIKAESPNPLQWLDAEVEAVCKEGRL